MKLCVVLVLLGTSVLSEAGRILFLIPGPSRSHYILNEYLVEQLIERGHEVTLVSSFKRSTPLKNVTEILLPDIGEILFGKFLSENSTEGKFQMRNMNAMMLFSVGKIGNALAEDIMGLKHIKDLMTFDRKFDLVLGENFLIEGLLGGLAHRFKIPLVLICPTMPFAYVNEMAGNEAPPAYVPDTLLGFSDKMTFQQRLLNFLYNAMAKLVFYNWHIPQQDELLKKYFGEDDPPSLMEILRNNSLTLVNHHFSVAFPRPYVPNMVEIGGYHVRPAKPLSEELGKFIEDAKDGVIYFSMGTNLKSAEFPKEKFEGILRAFSRLKQKVLWKFESENPPNLPKNVKISKWLPQADILAHPNVRLFITHGGLLSLTESILRGVPVIGIPVFGDQPANVRLLEQIEVGVKLKYDDIGEESLYSSIREVLDNPKYTENVKLRSRILRDRPVPPIETAIFWVEYAMRHKGTPYLRSGMQDLAWYQANLVDVLVVVGVVISVIVYSLGKIVVSYLFYLFN